MKSSCIENIFSAGVETNARPPFFFILTVSKGSIIPPPLALLRAPEGMEGSGVPGFVFVVVSL